MGLDMYLRGEKYLRPNWENPEKDVKEDGFRLSEKILELGYWRKHPNLHGYIVPLVLTALVIGFVVQVLRPTGIFGE